MAASCNSYVHTTEREHFIQIVRGNKNWPWKPFNADRFFTFYGKPIRSLCSWLKHFIVASHNKASQN